MLRNDHEHSAAKRLLVGLLALKRGIDRMVESYRDYAIAPAAGDLISRLDVEIQRVSTDINQYQVGRYSTTDTTERSAFALLERVPELPHCLIEARLALNWTQYELAEHAQFPRQQINRYENNSYANISLTKAIDLSKAITKEYNERKPRRELTDILS